MSNKDLPVMNHAIHALNLQKKEPKLPILERIMFYAKTEYEFAGAYLALWHWKGTEPVWEWGNLFQAKAVHLAKEVRKAVLAGEGTNITSIGIRRDVLALCRGQQQITTPAYYDREGSSYSDYRPLGKAELERRAERANKTGVYFPKARKRRSDDNGN